MVVPAADAPPAWLWVLVPLLFFTTFPLFWCFVVWLISLAGWRQLGATHAATSQPEGRLWLGQYGMVGVASYKGTLQIHVGEAGFFMETFWPFRVAHPRLFIPWADVQNLSTSRLFWGREVAVFSVGVGSSRLVTLRLPAAIFREAGRLQ